MSGRAGRIVLVVILLGLALVATRGLPPPA